MAASAARPFASRARTTARRRAAPAVVAPRGAVDRPTSPPPTPSTTPHALVAALASAGALETAYLTWAKLAHAPVTCPTGGGGCASVLGSDYATLLGAIPLPAVGCATYAIVAGLAARRAAGAADGDAPLAAGAAALATASAALVTLLTTRFSAEPCAWCWTSAGLSAAIAAAVFGGMGSSQLKAVALPSASAALATILSLTLSWAGIDPPSAFAADSLPFAEPELTRASSPRALDLARRLRSAGARMYGAFWCSHCFEQRQAFGVGAAADLPYVECYPNGFSRSSVPAPACVTAGIEGFPSWVIGGEKLEGEQTFEELEAVLARAAARGAVRAAVGGGAGLPVAPSLRMQADPEAPAAAKQLAAAHAATPDTSLAAVLHLLRRRPPYARLVFSEVLSSLMNWFSYVAILRSVSALAPPHQQSFLVGAVTALKYLPGILFPATGWAADTYPRELVLAVSASVSGAAIAAQACVIDGAASHATPALLLALVLLQNTAAAFYDPARAALTPRLVARHELRLASTIDTAVWSVCQAVGASAGGVALSRLGPSFCFAVDAAFYFVCAAAALTLRGHADRPVVDGEETVELAKLKRAQDGTQSSPRIKAGRPPASSPRTPSRTLGQALSSAASDVVAGVRYCAHNLDVAILASCKTTGCLVWGPADFLNVVIATSLAQASPRFDADTIAGFLFGAVGVGCVLGSVVANATVAHTRPALLRAVAGAAWSLAAGYACLAAASTSLPGAAAASAVRSAGSAVLWSYSTLLLQLSVPDGMLGRVAALEQAGVSVSRSAAIGVAAVMDAGGASVASAAVGLTLVGSIIASWWTAYAARIERREKMLEG